MKSNALTTKPLHEIFEARVERLRITNRLSVFEAENILKNTTLDRFFESTSDDLIIVLQKHIASGQRVETKEIHVPATWWQHFKEDCFPKWLLKHFPVRTKKIGAHTAVNMCPHTSVPEGVNHFRFLIKPDPQPHEL